MFQGPENSEQMESAAVKEACDQDEVALRDTLRYIMR